MKQIVVISGKGGTGKTVLTASFAALVKNSARGGSDYGGKVMADCDVDAADLYLLLHPTIKKRYEFRSGKTAKIDKKLCELCGKCIVACRFDAISKDFVVDPISCEGCALCSYICPAEAIKMQENLSGEWYISETKYGPFVHAKLGIAEENSGKLVTKVKQAAKEIAQKQNKDYVIVDGPPGIGCPVIASLADADLALIVTEPTLSGIHDMQRIMDVALHFKITTQVVINKYDLNVDNAETIESMCKDKNIDVIGRIPFSKKVSESIVKSVPIIEYIKDDVSKEIVSIWEKIK